MFVPINAKADVQGSKKGKLTPAQNAQLNAFCLASKTGILDCLGKCEYSSQTSLTVVNNKVDIIFKSGYVVICGRLVECEEGTSFTLDNLADGQEGSVVLRYNLENSGEQEFVITKKMGVLDDQDLNNYPLTGKYDFELYKYKVQSNTVTLTRSVKYVPDIGGKLSQFEASLKDKGKPLYGYNDSKGTIEERLTRLGFRKGSVTLSEGNATVNYLKRQGNFVIGEISATNVGAIKHPAEEVNIMTIPHYFRPTHTRDFKVAVIIHTYNAFGEHSHTIKGFASIEIEYDGVVKFYDIKAGEYSGDLEDEYGNCKIAQIYASFGYEAPPIY